MAHGWGTGVQRPMPHVANRPRGAMVITPRMMLRTNSPSLLRISWMDPLVKGPPAGASSACWGK